ncbi:MAG: hypothetical protein B6I20_12045 [Bacteroidetes bacterium 4572_117]|nr:MAG: hypothetical protein B6I20_12045 [Bacteroidetes bacterium 4572_117]
MVFKFCTISIFNKNWQKIKQYMCHYGIFCENAMPMWQMGNIYGYESYILLCCEGAALTVVLRVFQAK